MTWEIDGYAVTRSGNTWIASKDGKRIEADSLSHLIIKIDQEGIE